MQKKKKMCVSYKHTKRISSHLQKPRSDRGKHKDELKKGNALGIQNIQTSIII